MRIKLVQLPEMFWEENNAERKRYALFSLMALQLGLKNQVTSSAS